MVQVKVQLLENLENPQAICTRVAVVVAVKQLPAMVVLVVVALVTVITLENLQQMEHQILAAVVVAVALLVILVVKSPERVAPESQLSASIRRRRHEIRTDRQRNRDKHYFPE